MNYAKGGDVARALQRLMASLKEDKELAPQVAHLQSQAEAAVPRVPEPVTPRSPMGQLADQAVNQVTARQAIPQPTDRIISRLNMGTRLHPGELNHLLYSSPEANQAINAYQGAMDRNAVTPEIRQALVEALQKQQELGPTVLNPPAMAEGGEVDQPFDPVSHARERVYPSSSPGSPGVSGAIKDAIEALQSYLTAGHAEIAEDRDQQIMRQAEDHADGGTVEGPSTEHERAGLGKRFGVRVMEQAYGLDDKGEPAFGGRAWTKGQSGTPLGILDEITAAPHNLLSLLKTTRGLDPLRKRLGNPGLEDSLIDSIDPQWSQAAALRLDALRSAMNEKFNVGEAHSIPEHMTDAAASLVSPVPMTKAGEAAGPLKRLLEMTIPARPRTLRTFGTDTALLGGVTTGLDALTDRLSRLRAQANAGSGQPVDPRDFSQAMGVQPEESAQDIHNSHAMIPMVGEHGDIYYGVPPETL